jgi:membrane protein
MDQKSAHNKLLKYRLYRIFIVATKKIILPGFDKLPLYNVGGFFIAEMQKESIITKASSLAFNFFLALFPALLFLLTLIPFVPIENFQDELLSLLAEFLPNNAFEATRDTIIDIINNQQGGILSLAVLFALIFSTNGIASLMQAFNKSSFAFESRSWIKQRLIALGLTLSLAFLLFIAVALIVAGEYTISWLQDQFIIRDSFTYYALATSRWFIILGIFFVGVSLLYYFGPAVVKRWRFVSAGSTLATVLIILTSYGFSFYINNFGQYNKLYGSIGTIVVIMLWIYFNSIVLLVGFELNASIDITKRRLEE